MNRISINEPCHENWAAMTPSQQGAFCGKCQIDVIDFSGKSANEVKSILQENTGKHLCGRFKKTQLDDLNTAYLEWDNQSTRVFQSKFLYACLIVFGMTLFSCNAPEEMIMGDPPQADENNPPTEQVDAVVTQEYSNVRGTSKEQKHTEDNAKYLKGKVDYNYVQNQQTNCTEESETEFVKGDIAYIPEDYKTGLVMITPGIQTDSSDVISNEDTDESNMPESFVEVNSETIFAGDNFTGRLYPNPTGTMTTLVLEIKETGIYKIELYNSDGQKVMDLFSGELMEGESNHRIDLSDHASDTYLISVQSAHQIQTYQMIKM